MFNFNIKSLVSKSSAKGNTSIRIFNLNGQLVFHKENINLNQEFAWDASKVPSGIYLVNIHGSDFNHTSKLVKR